ncbi:MAG: hypothetical protein M0Q12_03070 [Synergistaceae bacterium]|jgi:hypothetical protein|nr:hypothetical protein [Synergistaceae bacterium]
MQNKNQIIDKFTIDDLLHRSWIYKNSEAFFKFFNFIGSFHHYSRYNTMLVYLQNEAVTFFGGKSFWKKRFERGVKKDARPYVILAPMGPVMLVYDVMDTEGEETAEEFLRKGFGRNPFDVKGELPKEMFDRAMEIANSFGIKITFQDTSILKGGHITTIIKGNPEIVISTNGTIEVKFATFIHELAHLFLGHTGHPKLTKENDKKEIKIFQRKLSRSAEELEAETVSFLLSKKLGLETNAAEYIAAYIRNESDLIEFSYESVIKAADRIDQLFKLSDFNFNIQKQY